MAVFRAAPDGHIPLGYFMHADGAAARPVLHLGWVFGGISVAVCAIIAFLLCAAVTRARPAADSREIAGRGNDGLGWIYIGTGVSVLVLLGMGIYMLAVMNAISAPPYTPALTLTVTGYQWWWKVDYPGFTTANEIHIPVGVPVLVELKSADVIHTFWVPRLAGKTQMIPGLANRQWIEADAPGVYRGQCAEFCGVQHAHMAFEVVAEAPADFARWQARQRAAVKPPAAAAARAGERVFMNNCAACHTVRGTGAAGKYGPDLTHLRARRRIAAGLAENTPGRLADWIAHAQELKPGARMPDVPLPPSDAAALLAYLSTLE